ncbi:hydroxymethylglutaryl-CoA synthase family protein [Falsiroseomonas tokyonensis]|uniref:Hydroxymethylglutaryl-CoA synthase family protein n=1 Tax=Falsiroseomonas tokyonensis TaxID=430521 RepID=A0ABV7BRK9_9PROT|nr:hydroxymethylglutaryl-CoA synthase [Falsiroseomonas tokyonensis]MBU8536757.1 hydroxymethylglutaryl-CoA synthase family protein [Falsiroseomonas tokyonensis]
MSDAIGIEDLGVYAGRASLDVAMLAEARGLNQARFANLLMRRKSLCAPWEDAVSFAVNAARPVVAALAPAQRQAIELVIVATESGLDWGKSAATYVHHHLELPKHCRLFEVKQACYGGTAALQMAAAMVAASPNPEARALVIATDLGRPVPHSYAEPSQGSAAVALLVSRNPVVLALESGASGVHGYEVMDACRPTPEIETGDADLSVLSYLDCLEHSFRAYVAQQPGVDFVSHFSRLAWHTPFGGMVKGAHRNMMRKFRQAPPSAAEADFEARLRGSLLFCQEVGNIYSGTVFLALAGALASSDFAPQGPERIGLFSYGSGCCSEFYSGLADARSAAAVRARGIGAALQARRPMDMPRYEALIARTRDGLVGTKQITVARDGLEQLWEEGFSGTGLLVLDRIENYQRRYRWA